MIPIIFASSPVVKFILFFPFFVLFFLDYRVTLYYKRSFVNLVDSKRKKEFYNMSHSINQNITPAALLKFAAPSIVMMVFMSLYTIVDGIFVSRFLGSNALSSLNIVYPVVSVAVALSTMLGTGGSAIVSKYLGEGKNRRAREALTQFVVLALLLSFILLILSEMFLTSDALLVDCRRYLGIIMMFVPACMLQSVFQSFLATAGYPGLGLVLMIAAGICNVAFDYVLIVPCQMGIAGAALATGIGQCIPAVCGLFFFLFTKQELRFCHFTVSVKEILNACYNGSSEMVSQLSNAVITFLFNIVMMSLAGENGVAAITILLYGQFLFNAVYMGFSIGISPIVGFQYGAGNKEKLRKIYRISFMFVMISSVLVVVVAVLFSPAIVTIFTKDQSTWDLAAVGFRIFAVNFLFSGINVVSSGFFTALSNGKVSALISFSRTLGFIVVSLLTLPSIFGITGAWLAVPVAEFMTMIFSGWMHRKYFWMHRKQNYLENSISEN